MGKQLVSDELWGAIEPLLPEEPPKPKGGRPGVPDRAALAGIIFVLKSGIPWEMLPIEMGCGSRGYLPGETRRPATSRSVGKTAPSLIGPTGRSRPNRLVES